jgi:hypothetical protein
MRRILRLSAAAFIACNGYHLFHCAARLTGLYALRDATRFDPAALDALIAEYDVHTAS